MAKRRRRNPQKGGSPNRGFYDRPIHQRLFTRITDGLITSAVMYFLSPYLLKKLAPVQAQINASAQESGAAVSNVGTAKVANELNTQTEGADPSLVAQIIALGS